MGIPPVVGIFTAAARCVAGLLPDSRCERLSKRFHDTADTIAAPTNDGRIP